MHKLHQVYQKVEKKCQKGAKYKEEPVKIGPATLFLIL